jgi:hypothetical protein
MTSSIKSLSLWYENDGINKIRIDAIFTTFKLISIFSLSSIPFWLNFDKTRINIINNSTILDYDIAHIQPTIQLGGLWGYYFITYLIVSYFIANSTFKKLNDVLYNKDYFASKGLSIYSTESTTIDQLLRTIEIEKEEFLTESLATDNFLLALDDQMSLSINLPPFKSMLATRPFEIAITNLLKHYYIDTILWTFKNQHENSAAFSSLSKKIGLVIIPFIPVLIIFSCINHIITYVNNRDFLSVHDWNRLGIWKFRYYNEFLILARKRLDKAKDAAESVITDLYLENWKSSVSKALSFLTSLFSLFLLLFSFNGYTTLFGIDIITLIAIFSVISAMLFPRKKSVDGRMNILKTLQHDITRKEIPIYFESKLSILFKEIISILYLPVLFIWSIPNQSYFIAVFMSSYNKEGICTFANWENKNKTTKTKASYDHIALNGQDSFLFQP